MLISLRSDKYYDDKNIVLYLDNAAIHSHSNVLDTARRMQVNVLFSAPYSPWLNPIEHLFYHLKRKTREETINNRYHSYFHHRIGRTWLPPSRSC